MKKWFLGILSVLFVFVLAACGGDDENNTGNASSSNDGGDKVFKIGGIPDQDVSELNRRFQEIADYIGEETGLTVEYVPSNDYAALVKAFERGEVHLAWFGGLTGVQAQNAVEGAEAIAQRPRDAEFHSVFVAQKDLGLESLEDVKGLSFTFGSESSTSGHLMPRYYMMEAGIDPNTDLDGDPNYSGSHDKTYKLVESGAYQVGALNEAVWESAVEEGKVDTSKVDVFYTTPSYYDYNWTINNVDEEFGEGTKEKVKEALLSVTSEQEAIVDLFQTDKFIETKNENYDMIRQVAKELGIIK